MSHSAGLCFIMSSHMPDNEQFSFALYDGELLPYYGWGWVGTQLQIHSDINPIDGPVHTVYVDNFNDQAKETITGLCAEHRRKYGQCYVEHIPYDSPVASWFQSGMPLPEPESGPESSESDWSTDKGEEES